MAKMGMGLGAGAPMAASPRPMPNPVLNPGVQPQPKPTDGGGFLGPKGSKERYDMAMEFLKMAMSAAPNSNSPVLQALAPIAGALVGGRMEKVRSDAKAAEITDMTEALLGPAGLNPAARKAMGIMNNEDAPDYLKAIAKKQFEAALAPAAPAGGRPRSSRGKGRSSGGSGTSRQRLYGTYEIDGILHGRTADGRMVPYTDPNGNPVTSKGSIGAPPGPPNPPLPTDPVMPKDPGTPDNDPLGIRG